MATRFTYGHALTEGETRRTMCSMIGHWQVRGYGPYAGEEKSAGRVIEIEEYEQMPFVNIKITDEGVTKEQKLRLIQGATQLLVDVLGKNPATTIVVIDEVNTDNWGIGFDQVTDLRKA